MKPVLTLEWKDSYQIGDALIDAQHQRLFELANAALISDSEESLNATVMQLFRYTREHFTAEEELMAKRKYAGLAQQRIIHNDLLTRLSAIASAPRHDITKYTIDLHTLMINWVLKHILEDDMQILH